MSLAEHFGGRAPDISEIKTKKAVLAIARDADIAYPAAASSGKIYNLGVFEHKTIKRNLGVSKTIKIHTGADKALTMISGVEGVGVSNWDLDELQELLDETNLTVFVLDVNSYYSDDNFDITSKYIPDDVAVRAHLILSGCQVSISVNEADKEVGRVVFSAQVEETTSDMGLYHMENAYVAGGNNPWESSFGREFLDGLVDNSTLDKFHLQALRSMLWGYWDWTKNNVLTQGTPSQQWDHNGLTLTNTGCAYDSSGFYLQDTLGSDGLSQSSVPTTSGARFGLFVADFKIVGTVIANVFFKHGVGSSNTDDGYYIGFGGVDGVTFSLRSNNGATVSSRGISSIEGEDFNERALRYFLFDFKEETAWYYNSITGTFATSSNSTNNTLSFTDAGNGISTGLGAVAYDVNFYKFGYALF